jgi:formate dehydrogenase alpha subunit
MISFTINGKICETAPGTTILKAAGEVGITIPTLCYHHDLSPYGGCQLCLVEVEGAPRPVQSCTMEVREGMVIRTETPKLRNGRRSILELLLSLYYDSQDPDEGLDNNELMRWARYYKVPISKVMAREPRYPIDSDPNPFIRVDLNKCIMCTRCIRACAEIQGRFVWGVHGRGIEEHITAGKGEYMLDARCESCGACVAYCPTGALTDKMSIGAGKVEKQVPTTCTYCGVGCQVMLHVRDNHIIRVTSSPEGPVNGLRLCVKGRYGYDFVNHADRLTHPMVRSYLLEKKERQPRHERGEWVTVDWNTALEITAEKLANIRQTYGGDSIGMLSSAKCTNEENYMMNKFSRQVIGTNNVDHCARLCHSSTVAGLAASFGSGAMTNSMDDIASQANLVFVTGSNTTEQHPVFGTMLRQAVLRRGATLIVADPRRIDLTEFAALHLRMKPGTDIAMLNGLMHIILENGWEDKSFIESRTEGYDDFAANIQKCNPEITSEITGIPVEKLYQAARMLGTIKPGAVLWAMGITQHTVGVQNVQTLANLQMLLGNLGIPGGGINPLRGQNNVQGACDMGALPNVYPAYQPVIQDQIRNKFEAAWGISLNPKIGMGVTEVIPAAGTGKIKALYILGEDPVMSEPDANHVRHCLEELDFMVLQEIFPSETSVYADVILPGVSFAEKDGTYTNTERRVQLVRKALSPMGEARQDWEITSEIARRILAKDKREFAIGALHAGWDYTSPAQIMDEIASLAPSYAGVSHQRLKNGERLQWPVTSINHPGTPILHREKFTRGKGSFTVTSHLPPVELPDAEFPFLLNTGRVLYHWHGGEITRRAKGLLAVYPLPLVEINPEDASILGIQIDRELVRITSRRGSIQANAWISDRVPSGTIFANFAFPESPTNVLTIAALDPIAKIPEYKVCAVRLEKSAQIALEPAK